MFFVYKEGKDGPHRTLKLEAGEAASIGPDGVGCVIAAVTGGRAVKWFDALSAETAEEAIAEAEAAGFDFGWKDDNEEIETANGEEAVRVPIAVLSIEP